MGSSCRTKRVFRVGYANLKLDWTSTILPYNEDNENIMSEILGYIRGYLSGIGGNHNKTSACVQYDKECCQSFPITEYEEKRFTFQLWDIQKNQKTGELEKVLINIKTSLDPYSPKYRQFFQELSSKRNKRIDELLKLSNFIKTEYQSRCFPPAARLYIFERDGQKCKLCGRGIEELKKYNLHLEADHILAWEDGGKTTIENGQTVCSECNKAKHILKKRIEKIYA